MRLLSVPAGARKHSASSAPPSADWFVFPQLSAAQSPLRVFLVGCVGVVATAAGAGDVGDETISSGGASLSDQLAECCFGVPVARQRVAQFADAYRRCCAEAAVDHSATECDNGDDEVVDPTEQGGAGGSGHVDPDDLLLLIETVRRRPGRDQPVSTSAVTETAATAGHGDPSYVSCDADDMAADDSIVVVTSEIVTHSFGAPGIAEAARHSDAEWLQQRADCQPNMLAQHVEPIDSGAVLGRLVDSAGSSEITAASDSNNNNSIADSDTEQQVRVLLPEELLFLQHALGVIEVFGGDGGALSSDQLFDMLVARCGRRMAGRYAAYRELRARGWLLLWGVLYGADWLLYDQRGPAHSHAPLLVLVCGGDGGSAGEEEGERPPPWRHLAAVCRVSEQVAKRTLLVRPVMLPPLPTSPSSRPPSSSSAAASQTASGADAEKDFRLSLDCLSRIAIEELLINRWQPDND